MKKFCLILSAAALACGLFGEIKTPSIYSDNMVLQRGEPVKIRGWASPNARVEVSFAGQKKSVKAGADGKWSVFLDPMKADKTPREMVISENQKISKTIKNILVGEVWICGGQSNMQWWLAKTADGAAASARANYPILRYFSQNGYNTDAGSAPQEDSHLGAWKISEAGKVGTWSAVGFYFGEKLLKDLDVPVGLVYASRGATSMIAWLPDKWLEAGEYTKSRKAAFAREMEKYDYKAKLDAHNKKMVAAKAEDAKLAAEGKPKRKRAWDFHIPPFPNTPWAAGITPSLMYNLMVHPIRGYTARGVIWYQGEGDSGGAACENFEIQMKQVVDSWREAFENPKMPFYWVQLTSFNSETWPEARWRQLRARSSIPYSGVVNIIDAGEQTQIHPIYKTEVGERLEGLALREVYGRKDVHPYSPEFKSAKYSGDSARIVFETRGRKLEGRGEPRGFEVFAGGKWKPAGSARIVGSNGVEVKSKGGEAVSGARYLWKAWAKPDVWLYNQDALPAFSFTDGGSN